MDLFIRRDLTSHYPFELQRMSSKLKLDQYQEDSLIKEL